MFSEAHGTRASRRRVSGSRDFLQKKIDDGSENIYLLCFIFGLLN